MKLLRTSIAAVAGLSALNCWALDPQSINLAGFEFTPSLLVRQSYDDNFRGLRENVQSSWVTGISPTLRLSAEDRNSAYLLQYSAVHDIFHSYSEATNTDHFLDFKSIMEFTARHRLDWGLGYHRVEETVETETATENDKYSRSLANATYTFGAPSARNQLRFGTHFEARRYHNSGNINAQQERDSLELSGGWYHRLGARTRTILELRHTDHDYQQAGSFRDSTDLAALTGLEWEATARTSGSARFGYERKDFDSNNLRDYSNPRWEVGVIWEPRSYSVFSLDTRQSFVEGDQGATTIHDWTTIAGWRHDWTSRISSNLDYRFSDRDYRGIDRDDELTSYGLGLTYSPDRWIDLTLGYRRSHNDSTVRLESYKRNIYVLSVNVSL
ncbi:outer membrane beta-barrel protein [Stutzerimonas tarimensis]|uniref:Outer membrane beta-barrel protein n=1 Tax=Stutzerimonas tarimensis TaxID=1507735 RepID=A0ABV7T6M0_9GAMM